MPSAREATTPGTGRGTRVYATPALSRLAREVGARPTAPARRRSLVGEVVCYDDHRLGRAAPRAPRTDVGRVDETVDERYRGGPERPGACTRARPPPL